MNSDYVTIFDAARPAWRWLPLLVLVLLPAAGWYALKHHRRKGGPRAGAGIIYFYLIPTLLMAVVGLSWTAVRYARAWHALATAGYSVAEGIVTDVREEMSGTRSQRRVTFHVGGRTFTIPDNDFIVLSRRSSHGLITAGREMRMLYHDMGILRAQIPSQAALEERALDQQRRFEELRRQRGAEPRAR